MNKFFVAAAAVATMVFAGCASTPVQGYSGSPRSAGEVAMLFYEGNTMDINLMVYKVDGLTSKDLSSTLYTYNSRPANDLALQLLPGTHDLELMLRNPHEVQVLHFSCEAGKTYVLTTEKGVVNLAAKTNGQSIPVPVTLTTVPLYQEPAETEPHAVLFEDGAGSTSSLYRVDGQPGPIGVRFAFTDVWSTKLSLRLTPGEHTLEYSGAVGKFYQRLVQTEQFLFEAGKTYTLSFERNQVLGLDTLKGSLVEVK